MIWAISISSHKCSVSFFIFLINSLTLINLFQAWNVKFLNKDSEDLKSKHKFWLKLIKKSDVKVIDDDVLLMTNSTSESYLTQSFCM